MSSSTTGPGRHQGLDPRHRRRDAAGAAQPHRRRRQAAARRQARVLQSGRLDQGPRGDAARRGRGARRAAAARRHDHRADLRQHRHRPGDRRAPQGLPRDRGDAGQDVEGEDRPPARLRRRGRRRAHRREPGLAAVLLPRRRPPDRGDPRRLPAQPVRQHGQPGDALRLHRAGAVAPVGRADHALRRAASAPAARSPASPATSGSRTPTSRSSAPTRSAASTPTRRSTRTSSRAWGRTSGRRPTTRRWSTAT